MGFAATHDSGLDGRNTMQEKCGTSNAANTPKNQPISADIAQFARDLASRAQDISDLVDDKLSPVMTRARLPSDDVQGNDMVEYPPLFSDLRSSLLNIEAALNSIVYAMSRTEL